MFRELTGGVSQSIFANELAFEYKCEHHLGLVIFVVYPRYGCQSGHNNTMPKLGGTTGIKPLVPVWDVGFFRLFIRL